jgi:hypothetical protein
MGLTTRFFNQIQPNTPKVRIITTTTSQFHSGNMEGSNPKIVQVRTRLCKSGYVGSQDTQGDTAQFTGLSLVFRVHDKESMQRLNMDSTVQTEGVSTSQENITVLGFQSCVRHTEIRRNSLFQTTDDGMEDEPQTQLTLQLLTACTQVDTCLPGAACVPFCTRWSCMLASPRT